MTYPFHRDDPFLLPGELCRLRDDSPVPEVRLPSGETAWVLTRYADIRAALRDDRLSRRPIRDQARTTAPDGFDFGASIAEPPGHTRWRRVITPLFGPKQAEDLRDRIGALTDRLLDEFAALEQPADLMSGLAFRLPIRVIAELFGMSDDEYDRLAEWASGLRNTGGSMAAFGTAMGALGAFVNELVERRRADPGRDLLSQLLTGAPDDEEPLTHHELVSTGILLVAAGFETVAIQLGNAFLALFRYPEQRERLRAEPGSMATAVEECLRFAQIGSGFAGAVYATTELTIGGVRIPAGGMVFVRPDLANRDPEQFSDPDLFDVGRTEARQHLTFGGGPHFCLGAALARVELQEGIGRVLRRFPELKLDLDPTAVELVSTPFSHYPRALPVRW
ncbi:MULTISPECIES: cytochrome P450 [unclassified Nocardia]|uniref:cytochrome P450 n=1 Tax=unclassified Nocardia TaxID=2637762 RepID=UPI001CE3D33D|nr:MULTISPECIES: cytochrome P450 [unclassified Nocardia]